jgi:hypothetical protein
MCVSLYTKYVDCGCTKSAGHEPCLNIANCGLNRERTERVEGYCQRCLENLKKMYRMNRLDFNTRGDGKVPGEPTFEKEKRRLEARVERKESGKDDESEHASGDVTPDWN